MTQVYKINEILNGLGDKFYRVYRRNTINPFWTRIEGSYDNRGALDGVNDYMDLHCYPEYYKCQFESKKEAETLIDFLKKKITKEQLLNIETITSTWYY